MKTEVISLCIPSPVEHSMKLCVPKMFIGLYQIHIDLKLVLKYDHCFIGVLINAFMEDIPNGSSQRKFHQK